MKISLLEPQPNSPSSELTANGGGRGVLEFWEVILFYSSCVRIAEKYNWKAVGQPKIYQHAEELYLIQNVTHEPLHMTPEMYEGWEFDDR